MPLLYPDEQDYLKCSCGSKVLYEQKVFTLKKVTTRKGNMFVKTLIGTRMRCTVCNSIIVGENEKLDITEN